MTQLFGKSRRIFFLERRPYVSQENVPSSYEKKRMSDLLDGWEGKSGVYIITPYFDEKKPMLVKVGMSIAKKDWDSEKRIDGISSRLQSYLLCYPQGFSVIALFSSRYNHAYRLEKDFQQYLTTKGYKTDFPHSRTEEWYRIPWSQLKKGIQTFEKHFAGSICKKSVFLKKPFFLKTNGRISNRPIMPVTQEEKEAIDSSAPNQDPLSTVKAVKKRRFALSSVDVPNQPQFD